MKTKMKFDDIKGMLRREEMKEIIGGSGYAPPVSTGILPGTTLSGSQNANLGITINYGNGGGDYSTSYNYGVGMNGGSASGNNSTIGTGGSSTTGANTYNNVGYAKP